jgi:hypothetical protein
LCGVKVMARFCFRDRVRFKIVGIIKVKARIRVRFRAMTSATANSRSRVRAKIDLGIWRGLV